MNLDELIDTLLEGLNLAERELVRDRVLRTRLTEDGDGFVVTHHEDGVTRQFTVTVREMF